MADVFISYSRLDRARVDAIAERLASLGYTVRRQPAEQGAASAEACARQIESAAAILVVWTHRARASAAVFAQAAHALDAGKLLQMRLDAIAPPAPFDALALADMSGDKSGWGPLEDALARLANGAAMPEAEAPLRAPGPLATAPPLGAPKRLTSAASLSLAAFAFALWAAYAGAMPLDYAQYVLAGAFTLALGVAAFSAFRLLAIRRAGG
ncbi:MAG: toll/interleukin-1 receptor domain-containing protein [Terricaulis sp.]|nr:toll/interleukin-1 receptor domain-containing protein [Terricaulis sp.]